MQKRIRFKISAGSYNAATLDAESALNLLYDFLVKANPAKETEKAVEKARAWLKGAHRSDEIYDGGTFALATYIPDPSKIVRKERES